MGFRRWWRVLFGRDSPEMVPFLDAATGRVVQIPASELRPGTIQVRLQDSGEIVWALPEQLHHDEIKHPTFDEGVRDYIRQIQSAFAEHRAISFEEWEDGFRCDDNPDREIALWSHAADVYMAFAVNEPSAERRRDIYRCLVACLTTGPKDVWKVLRPQVLRHAETEAIVKRFFGQ